MDLNKEIVYDVSDLKEDEFKSLFPLLDYELISAQELPLVYYSFICKMWLWETGRLYKEPTKLILQHEK